MAQVINTNVSALFASVALNKSAQGLQTAQQRLSSGLRINTSKDDATGMAIAAGYDARIRGANQLAKNANNAISTAQTSDGYLGQILENTQRLREIYIQTSSVTGAEATALLAENARIDGLITATGSVVVDEAGGSVVGAGVAFTAATSASLSSVANFDTEITRITSARAQFGADMAALGSAVSTLQVSSVNLSAAYSRVMDTDYAVESTNATRNSILQQAGTAALAQANQTPALVLSLLQ
jgi:flagellin